MDPSRPLLRATNGVGREPAASPATDGLAAGGGLSGHSAEAGHAEAAGVDLAVVLAFLTPGERTAILIGGPSFFNSCKNLGINIDYRRLRETFAARCNLVRCGFYIGQYAQDANTHMPALVEWLSLNGYVVTSRWLRGSETGSLNSPASKEPATEQAGLIRRKPRIDMDVEMALDLVELSNRIDHIVLFSHAGSLRAAVERAQQRGCRVTLVSSIAVPPGYAVADEDLRRQVDGFVEIGEIRDAIAKLSR